jgi:16S rRNA (cytosine1402-N4)-methyltransferase
MSHIPVLLNEVIQYLDPKPNENFIDGTVGEGGHAAALLQKTGPMGKLLGIDLDEASLSATKFQISNFKFQNNIEERLILAQGNFKNIKEIAETHGFNKVAGILLDLGLCSRSLEQSNRGFTFQKNEPLDMRFGGTSDTPTAAEITCPDYLPSPQGGGGTGIIPVMADTPTAAEIINTYSELELGRIIREFGEEPYAKQIANAIITTRKKTPITTTFELVNLIRDATPSPYHRQKIHPATRTFQALRIAVNHELENLAAALPQAIELLKPNGRLAIISYHSLEDRIVKHFFKQHGNQVITLTKKPIRPSLQEIQKNPRSRSAKLRVVCKIS